MERGHPVRASCDNLDAACPRADAIFLRDWTEHDSRQSARMFGYGL